MHFAYWPPQLNVKILPKEVKQEITEKYEKEFYPWLFKHWYKFTGIKESSQKYHVNKAQWLNAPYGLKRFKGLIKFMNSEDWSARLPETREYLNLVNKRRNWDDKFLKVFPLFEKVMREDKE
mgnify:FL=1